MRWRGAKGEGLEWRKPTAVDGLLVTERVTRALPKYWPILEASETQSVEA